MFTPLLQFQSANLWAAVFEGGRKMRLTDGIQYVKGIGEARAKLFARLGIRTVSDLIYHLPRACEDRSEIKQIAELMDGETVCVSGSLAQGVRSFRGRNRVHITQTAVSDGSGIIRVTWFNAPYMAANLTKGSSFTFYGTAAYKGGGFEMVNPVIESNTDSGSGKTGRIIPIYPATAGLNQTALRNAIKTALSSLSEMPRDIIPPGIREEYDLMPIDRALRTIHMPENFESYSDARRRLAFEELLVQQAGLCVLGSERKKYFAAPFSDVHCIKEFAAALPFELTGAQKRVINEICADLMQKTPMNRLVQGDVGSGKTMVAAAAMFAAVRSGFQAALMAPTEILANQHYANLKKLFSQFGFETVLLCGGMPAAEKRAALAKIASGEANIIIGTHALLTETVKFDRLNLVITDEQHRFGVRQRTALTGKGGGTHTLVMTATPIPRTLSLILYGDLDVSVIDELPPGRKPIETFSVTEGMRKRVYSFIAKNISEGRQVYIVCPLVEESETLTAKSAVEYAEKLKKEVFPHYNIDVIHGKLKAKDKEEVMRRFTSGEANILVATTVIEVGVDVPNATVMVIENAERFGLSQLHQLRGRIGRGSHSSYCIMFSNNGKLAKERMKVMCETNDGFKISEKDLQLRGPGEFFGVRQHGLPELKAADLACDMILLKQAQDAAHKITATDPSLSSAENRPLRERIGSRFSEVSESGIFN